MHIEHLLWLLTSVYKCFVYQPAVEPHAGRLAISFLVFASFLVFVFFFFCIEASQTNLFLYQISSFTIVKISFIASIITMAMIDSMRNAPSIRNNKPLCWLIVQSTHFLLIKSNSTTVRVFWPFLLQLQFRL